MNISYQPDINSTNKRLPATLIWTNYIPVEAGTPQVKYVYSTDIYPYCTKQFIFCKPFYPLDKNSQKPFSGLTLIEQETKDNIGISTATLPIVATRWVVGKPGTQEDETLFYCGDESTYDGQEDLWVNVDSPSANYTIFDDVVSANYIRDEANEDAGTDVVSSISVII